MADFFSNAVGVLKDHPVVTSIVVALVASAILNRVLAKMSLLFLGQVPQNVWCTT
jgi:hypothetical protein